jgi:hypothetical protein
MRTRRSIFLAPALVILALSVSHAYVLTGPKWAANPVPYYINPANSDVSQSAAISAIQTGASAWSMQSNANISLYYMGQTSGNTLQNNGKNEIFFRNTSNGGTIAETYWWGDSTGHFIDADIVFYDGGFLFFTGSSGCSGGVYIEDTATHEFGHVLGLSHSGVTTATMYPTMSWCSTSWRSLDPDDQAGIETLYPPSSTNTAPSVTITTPAPNSSFAQGTAVTFIASATDKQDGDLSSRITWRSSLDGAIGAGSSINVTLSAGTQTVYATVTDSGGLSTTAQVTVTITTTQTTNSSGINLSASGRKVKGSQQVALSWSGASASYVDVFRNGAFLWTTANDGSQTDAINKKGSGTYSYQLCNTGTSTCSPVATVVF